MGYFLLRLPLHDTKATEMNRYGLVMNIPVQDVNTTSLVYFHYYGYQFLGWEQFPFGSWVVSSRQVGTYRHLEIFERLAEETQERPHGMWSQRGEFRRCEAHTLLQVCLPAFWPAPWLTWPAAGAGVCSWAPVASLRLPWRDSQPGWKCLLSA